MLRYHLGILKLLEAIERNKRIDLLLNLKLARSDSEQGAMNILKFGLYARAPVPKSCPKITETKDRFESMNIMCTASFIAIDPWPDNIIATVQLISTAINGDRKKGLIGPDAFDNLRETLFETIRQLPGSTKQTCTALHSLYHSMFDQSKSLVDPICPTGSLYSEASASSTLSTHDYTQNRIEHQQQHIQREPPGENYVLPSIFTDKGIYDLAIEVNNVGLSYFGSLISSNDIKE